MTMERPACVITQPRARKPCLHLMVSVCGWGDDSASSSFSALMRRAKPKGCLIRLASSNPLSIPCSIAMSVCLTPAEPSPCMHPSESPVLSLGTIAGGGAAAVSRAVYISAGRAVCSEQATSHVPTTSVAGQTRSAPSLPDLIPPSTSFPLRLSPSSI